MTVIYVYVLVDIQDTLEKFGEYEQHIRIEFSS